MSLLLLFKGGGAVTHDTTGALTGPGSAIVGAAARSRIHATSGTLDAGNAVVSGSAARTAGVVNHVASGALVGPGSAVVGSAARIRIHASSGALDAGSAIVVGSAVHAPLYPDPSDVRAGVQYGPGGIYTGALTIEGGSTIIRLRSFTERH